MQDGKTKKRFGLDVEEIESDKFSSRVKKITHKAPPAKDMDELVERGQAISENITYLDEEVRLVESDEANEVVILRSDAPYQHENGDQIEYYQVELEKDGTTTIDRRSYQKSKTETQKTDFILSDRTLERLAKDLDKATELEKNSG